MPPEETTDVVAAETTAPDSSTDIETTTTDAVDTTATAEEARSDEVPEANRWAERARKAERDLAQLRAAREADQNPATAPDSQTEAIKAQIKAMGFVSQEEINAKLEEKEQDARVDRELSTLESKYDGKDGRPKFDRTKVLHFAVDNGIAKAEIAYKALHDKELTDWAIQQAVTKTRGIKTEGSDGSGSSQVGTTNEDLRAAIAKGDRSAVRTLIKRVTFGQ